MDRLLLGLIGSRREFFKRFDSGDGAFVSSHFVVYDDSCEVPTYYLGRFRRFGDEVYFSFDFRSYYFGNFWKRVVKRSSFSKGIYIVVSKNVLDSFEVELNDLL